MVAIGYSTLKRNVTLAATLTAALSGCASVDYTSQAELSAAQSVVPMAKPGSDLAYATATVDPNAVAGTQPTGMVTTTAALEKTGRLQPTVEEAAATAMTATTPVAVMPVSNQVAAVAAIDAVATGNAADPSMTASYAEMPLTDEMQAIQSVVPMKRPAGTELAYAAAPAASTRALSLNLMDFDTRPASVIEATPAVLTSTETSSASDDKGPLKSLISKYAKLYEVPENLVHRVVKRESTYNPKAYAHGNYGLMQIRYNTAKSMGYEGPASGLFDAETNLKYAVKYLRGAWLTADTDHDGAVKLYSTGYYYTAKRKGLLNQVQ